MDVLLTNIIEVQIVFFGTRLCDKEINKKEAKTCLREAKIHPFLVN